MNLASLLADVQRRSELWRHVSDTIWDTPELGLHEHRSSAALADALEELGFEVQRGVAQMPTAFVASYGAGRPVVALLGEFDALPGLSQARDTAEHTPLVPGGPGHGCGHNLLGTAAAAAAVAVKEAMDRGEVRGTVRFYGCPAEETLVGKVFMVKHRLFDDVDCALTWHPGTINAVWASSTMAMNSARFTFSGASAHAAADPWNGRSALDAVELMNTGVNYLREHVPPTTRIHYVITDGGLAPNVVPNRAQVWYYVRAPRRADVEDVYARILDIARGACLMTGTTHEVRLLSGCYDTLANRVLGDLFQEIMETLGPPRFTEDDRDLARRLQQTCADSVARELDRRRRRGVDLGRPGDPGADLYEGVAPHRGYGEVEGGSTDVGDVSYVVPTAQFTAVTAPVGTPGHSWQNVVSVGSGIGQKGMLFAAQVLAAAAARLLSDADLVARARDEFRAATGDAPYVSPVRDVEAPPLDL